MGSRRGISPVIATIILSAVVLTIGSAVWSYAQGASTVIATGYVNDTLTIMKEVTERFTVEHVNTTIDRTKLYVWVYNYGTVDIVVDIYANATHYNPATYSYTYTCKSILGTTPIVSGSYPNVVISFQSSPLQSGDQVAIKVHSRRQNNAYYTYYVP
jgi:flagellin-like protein